MKSILKFIKKETVFSISIILALISMLFVTPDKEYADYIDFKTLALLFCLMSVMAGYKKIGLFKSVGANLLSKTKKTRSLVFVLVILPFVFSMLITNDVALITFVPFALTVLAMCDEEKLIIPVVVLQTIAANLGSMLTPVGNPQNLYLYSKSGIGLGEFILLMLPYTLASFILLLIGIAILKSDSIETPNLASDKIPIKPAIVYGIGFLLSLLVVSKVLDIRILLVITLLYLVIFDRKILKDVDYALLGTFIGFFVFIGNLGRVDAFKDFLEGIIEGNETVVSVIASQVTSNVPAALLLSGFTDNIKALIVGTNLGGLGTLIASMASLISFKQLGHEYPEKRGKYLILFTISNIIFLAILLGMNLIMTNI